MSGSDTLRRDYGLHVAVAGILWAFLFETGGTALAQTNVARVFKIVYPKSQPPDSVRMFSSRTNLTSRRSILGYLTKAPTGLTERDVVILQVEPGVPGKSLVRFRRELGRVCNTTGAQLCDFHHSDIGLDKPTAIRELSVMHWKCPFYEPRNLSKTAFYLDEEFIGAGETGLKNLLRRLADKKPRFLGMAGSRYTTATGYGEFETPFGPLERQVYDCVRTNNIKHVHLNYDLTILLQEVEGFYSEEKPNRK